MTIPALTEDTAKEDAMRFLLLIHGQEHRIREHVEILTIMLMKAYHQGGAVALVELSRQMAAGDHDARLRHSGSGS